MMLRVMLTVYCLCEGWGALYCNLMTSADQHSGDSDNIKDLLGPALRSRPFVLTARSVISRGHVFLAP
jgi:hypothetical protein